MSTTNAVPPPVFAPPKRSVDDGQRRIARDELSEASERPQPGAFAVAGPDGRINTNRSGSDASQETGDGEPQVLRPRRTLVQNEDENSAMALVEANLVTPSDNGDVPLVEGQAVVEQSAADRKRKQRRRLLLILGLVLVASGITAGVTLRINSNRSPASLLPQSSPPSLSPSLSLSPSKSPAPSGAPTIRPNFRQLYESLPNHTTILLQNTRSPQYKAWGWLSLLDDTLNMELWKLRQRFALACFRFATTAFESYIFDQISPLDVDECNWTGIVCNASGSVMEIELSNSDLVGPVPRELYFLTELSALSLTDSSDLEWTLSSDIRLLSNLEVFNIAGTPLSGSSPTQLGRLSSLIRLDLSDTLISGILPTHLCQLPNLRWLNLHDNELSGPIPTHLGNLSSSLRWLDLSNNYFNGSLPSELGHLTQLRHLDLSYSYSPDSLPGFPTELGRLSQLTYLDLNVLTWMTGSSYTSIPTEIGQLTRLESLDLGAVKGPVPTEIGQLTRLESMEIEYSKNGTIPAEVGLMSRLTGLGMWGATGPIPTTFGQLTLLESLTITELSLIGSIPTELGKLSALTYLDLSFKNALTGTIPTELLGRLSNLTTLSISNFNGTIPTELGLLSNNLQSLTLSNSYVNGPIPTELGLLSELRYLDLSYKELTGTIPTELGRLTKLESMYLVDASVTGNVPSEICQLANISGGVFYMSIACDLVNCSCGVDVCFCQ